MSGKKEGLRSVGLSKNGSGQLKDHNQDTDCISGYIKSGEFPTTLRKDLIAGFFSNRRRT